MFMLRSYRIKALLLTLILSVTLILCVSFFAACTNPPPPAPFSHIGDSDDSASIAYSPAMTSKTIRFPVDGEERSVQVKWGAELFYAPSDVFNNDLALLSAALAAAAYNIDGHYRINRYYIYEAFRTLDFPSENIRLYSYPGHPQNQDGNNENPSVTGAADDSFAYAIANLDVNVSGEPASLIVIALRGTQTLLDGINLADSFARSEFMGDYEAYRSFFRFHNNVMNGLNDYISHYTFHERIYVLIAGHSLGGAAAQLVSATIQSSDLTAWSNVHTYTIGSPNPIVNRSDTGVVGSFNNIFNIVNPDGDWVIDSPVSVASKFGLILALPGIDEWGMTDDITAFIKEYNGIMGGTEQDALDKKGSHMKESYLAWILAEPTYGKKIAATDYSPDSPFP
jgi:hypothetical protein